MEIFDELDRLDKEEIADTDLSEEKTDDMGVARRSGEESPEVRSMVAMATSSSSVDILIRPDTLGNH